MGRKIGFTLAEVLITLGIIGVVAALTIPNLMKNYQKQQYVVQLKEVYSDLSQALNQLKADEGVDKISDTDEVTYNDTENNYDPVVLARVGNFLKKYFKVAKDCGTSSVGMQGCFSSEGNLSGVTWTGGSPMGNAYCVTISNGATICMVAASTNSPGAITIDINGLKKPNIAGRDIFNFSYYYDGSLDDSTTPECRRGVANRYGGVCWGDTTPQARRQTVFDNNCLNQNYGAGCLGKIINDGWKMDY